jgi:hypothetical protein
MGQLTARQTARRAALEARVRDHHPLGAGLTVDTTHVVLSAAESRQSLYVALTRGRSENHIYLADAAVEPDSLPGVDSLNPTTAEDILAGILRRDSAQTSATSPRRILDAPATQRRDAVLRYQDALSRAADHVLGQAQLAALRPRRRAAPHRAHHQPAYPTLRSRLALRALDGQNPTRVLRRSAELHELVTADDPAAVLDWRISHSPTQPGPLPAIPERLRDHRDWGGYLTDRARRVP